MTTSDPALQAARKAFRARLEADLAERRRLLAGHLDEVLAAPERRGRGSRPAAGPLPVTTLSLWPAAWPAPLTVRSALDLAEQDEALAELVAEDLALSVQAFVRPELQDDVLTDPAVIRSWDWPRLPGTPAELLWLLGKAAKVAERAWSFPFDAPDVLRWATRGFSALDPQGRAGEELLGLGYVSSDRVIVAPGPDGHERRYSVWNLALLAWAEWRRRPELLAWATMDRLAVEDPGPVHFALARQHAGDDEDARLTLAGELVRQLRAAREDLGMTGPPPAWGDDPPARDDMLALDAAGAGFLAGIGHEGEKAAEALRTKAIRLWVQFSGAQARLPGMAPDPATLYHAWWPDRTWPGTPPGTTAEAPEQRPSRFAAALCAVLWKDVVRRTLAARPFAILRVTAADGDDYVQVDKAAAAASWAFGGTAVTIDSDEYVAEPELVTRLMPRSWEMLPAAATQRPHQYVLPLETHDSGSLLVAAVGAAAIARKDDGTRLVTLPALVGKLTVIVLASVRDDEVVSVNLGDLTRELYPEAKRLRPREYARVTEALLWTKSLHLVLPDDTAIQCFDIRAALDPRRARPDQTIGWAIGRHLLDLTRHGARVRNLRGYFVLNKSGAMRLPNKRSALLRHYIRAAAGWNDAHDPATGRFNPRLLPAHTPEQWAAMTNTMSERAAEYAAASRGRRESALRRELSKARKEVVRNLEELADEHGLIRLELRGEEGKLVILPPDPLLEAYDRMRKGGTRPDR